MQLITGLSLGRPGFDPMPVHVKHLVDKVALGRVFEYCQCHFSMFHTHVHLNAYQMDKEAKPRNLPTRVIPSSMCAVRQPDACGWSTEFQHTQSIIM